MKPEYVANLQRPNNDREAIKKEAKDLVDYKVFSRDLLTYAIENFLESAEAYYDDFDPNKLYYKVYLNKKTRNLCFDIENLPHLLGLPNYKFLIQATIINTLIQNSSSKKTITSQNWLTIFKKLLEDNKENIIDYDSDSKNKESKKLNWDKIAEKVFSFLNIGILSNGDTNVFRENVAKDKVRNYVMTRDIISTGINGRIKIQFTIEKFNKEEILVPISIQYEENYQRGPLIMNGKGYIFDSKLTIEQKLGGNYGK